jgi:hypothetical protein
MIFHLQKMILNPSVLYAATGVHGQNSTTMALLAQECHKLKTGLRREETVSNQESQEIERTFRVQQIPKKVEKYPSENVVQGYLVIDSAGAEVRLRKIGDRYFETFKGSGRLQRRELEIELNPDQFHTLWPGTEGRRIEKIRYQMEDKGQRSNWTFSKEIWKVWCLQKSNFPRGRKAKDSTLRIGLATK